MSTNENRTQRLSKLSDLTCILLRTGASSERQAILPLTSNIFPLFLNFALYFPAKKFVQPVCKNDVPIPTRVSYKCMSANFKQNLLEMKTFDGMKEKKKEKKNKKRIEKELYL